MHDDEFTEGMSEEYVERYHTFVDTQDYAVNKDGDWFCYNRGYIEGHNVNYLKCNAIYNR